MDNEVLSSVPSESACGSSAESMSPLASFPSPGAAAAEPIAEVFARASTPPATQSGGHSQCPLLVQMEDALVDLVEWEGVAIQLEFSSAAILIIKRDHHTTQDQRRQMIMDWLQKVPSASMDKLREALVKSNQFVQAERIQVTSQIVPHQSNKYAKMIRSNEDKIKHLFSSLSSKIRSALESEGISVDDVHQHLVGLFLCHDLPRTDLVEIFEVVAVKQLWSYQHYDPLELLVEEFVPRKIDLVDKYVTNLTGFYAMTKLIDYIRSQSVNPTVAELSEDPNKLPLSTFSMKHYRKLKAKLKLDEKIGELSLKYVQDMWKKFARKFDLPFLTAVINRLLEGSLEIVWLILPYIAEMIAASAHISISFFRENQIIYVAIDDHPIYDAGLTEQLFETATRGNWQLMTSLLQNKDKMLNINFVNRDGKSLLIVAAEGGHELILLLLLDSGVDIDFKQEATGRSALFLAAENGRDVAISILLTYGADPYQEDLKGDTAYSIAMRRGNEKVCKELQSLESKNTRPAVRSISTHQVIAEKFEGARVSLFGTMYQVYHQMTSDLVGAARSDNLEAVKYILEENKVDINASESDKHGWTALNWAAEKGNFEMVDLLLERGADPNAVTKDSQWSSLMLASRKGYLQIAKLFLDHDAMIDHQNVDGICSLAIAIYERHTSIALLLIHEGANIYLQDKNGWTPLIRASNEGNLKLVKIIKDLAMEENVNDQTTEGWSSLMVASNYGHTEVVEELTNAGADLDMTTREGDTALHIATLKKHPDVVKMLAKLGANLDVSNKDGLTALMVATNKGYETIVDVLLEGGADVNFPHKTTKWTAIFFAAKNGNEEIVKKLLYHGARIELPDGTKVIDVASYLKHDRIVKALGTSLDLKQNSRTKTDVEFSETVRTLMEAFVKLEKRLNITDEMENIVQSLKNEIAKMVNTFWQWLTQSRTI